jgi:hypothetical protein
MPSEHFAGGSRHEALGIEIRRVCWTWCEGSGPETRSALRCPRSAFSGLPGLFKRSTLHVTSVNHRANSVPASSSLSHWCAVLRTPPDLSGRRPANRRGDGVWLLQSRRGYQRFGWNQLDVERYAGSGRPGYRLANRLIPRPSNMGIQRRRIRLAPHRQVLSWPTGAEPGSLIS